MSSPCRECMNRELRCHDRCADYLEFLDWARRKNDMIRQQKRSQDFYDKAPRDFAYTKFW